ncbi:MAG: hypothetical protein R2698_04395 [Microthrixaceae bacterium]
MSAAETSPPRPFTRSMPPVVGLGMVALTFAIVGGVLIAAQIGADPSLVLPWILVAVAVGAEIAAVALLPTIRPFAWFRFRQVFGVALGAYVLQSGVIEWSFLKNDIPAGPLTVLTIGLVVFATVVPLMIAFTVARYQEADDAR